MHLGCTGRAALWQERCFPFAEAGKPSAGSSKAAVSLTKPASPGLRLSAGSSECSPSSCHQWTGSTLLGESRQNGTDPQGEFPRGSAVLC